VHSLDDLVGGAQGAALGEGDAEGAGLAGDLGEGDGFAGEVHVGAGGEGEEEGRKREYDCCHPVQVTASNRPVNHEKPRELMAW
jgi:hypothetical protein